MRLGHYHNKIHEEEEALREIDPEDWKIFVDKIQSYLSEDNKSDIQKLCRQTISEVQKFLPKTNLRVYKAHIYIRILRRKGIISYRQNKGRMGIDGLRFGTKEEILQLLEDPYRKNRLLGYIKEEGFIEGWAKWARGYNKNSLSFRVYTNAQKAMQVLNGNPSTKSHIVEKVIGFREGTLKKVRRPERTKRIATRNAILENERFKQYLIQELRAYQSSGYILNFEKAMQEAIRKWNRYFAEDAGLFLPISIFGGSRGISLCSILGVSGKSIDSLLSALRLPEGTWRKSLKRPLASNTSKKKINT